MSMGHTCDFLLLIYYCVADGNNSTFCHFCLTCDFIVAGSVELSHVELEADDGEHEYGHEQQQANLQQGDHSLHDGLEHHLQAWRTGGVCDIRQKCVWIVDANWYCKLICGCIQRQSFLMSGQETKWALTTFPAVTLVLHNWVVKSVKLWSENKNISTSGLRCKKQKVVYSSKKLFTIYDRSKHGSVHTKEPHSTGLTGNPRDQFEWSQHSDGS